MIENFLSIIFAAVHCSVVCIAFVKDSFGRDAQFHNIATTSIDFLEIYFLRGWISNSRMNTFKNYPTDLSGFRFFSRITYHQGSAYYIIVKYFE